MMNKLLLWVLLLSCVALVRSMYSMLRWSISRPTYPWSFWPARTTALDHHAIGSPKAKLCWYVLSV